MSVTDNTIILIAPGYRLQWEEAQDCHVLLYPEGMVKLNMAAGEILKRCDGKKTVNELIADLNNSFPDSDLKNDVYQFLEVAQEHGWIKQRTT